MIEGTRRTSVLVLAGAAALVLLVGGCSSRKKVDTTNFPKTVEANVEARQSDPDKIGYIELKPWSAKAGDTVQVTMSGTPGRTAALALTGVEGEANGKTQRVDLTPGADGNYTGSLTIGPDLPPGKYRIEGELSGGPTGQPVRLVSSRALTVEGAPRQAEATGCEAVRKAVEEPRIHFAFNEADITPETETYVTGLAQQLAGAKDQVARIVVEGHCDERGTVNYNLELGARRARAVQQLLAGQAGLEGLSITTVSRGEESPVVPNAQSEEDHAQNRRAVFVVECKQGQ